MEDFLRGDVTDFESEDKLTVDESGQLDENTVPVNVELVYRTQDFTVDSLVNRLMSKHIIIPSSDYESDDLTTERFQRDWVWKKSQMDRFIESILLGYPLPGIFLVRQGRDKKLLVLDGQQRLRTLKAFYDGKYTRGKSSKPFALDNVTESLRGLSIDTLSDDQRRTLDDTYMQGTIIEVDENQETLSAVYSLFERLNTGGTFLTPHEIRFALFSGKLFAELADISARDSWRTLYGKRPKRKRDHELLLRAFAFIMNGDDYAPPLKGFLNRAAEKYRDLSTPESKEAILVLREAIETLASAKGAGGFRRERTQVNTADAEAVLSALALRIKDYSDSVVTKECIERWLNELRSNQDFVRSTSEATANLTATQTRRIIAEEMLSRAVDSSR